MVSKKDKTFEIELFRLKDGNHKFTYSVENDFFDKYQSELFQNGRAHVILDLNKNERLLELSFNISGNFELLCDRSLEYFEDSFSVSDTIRYIYGETYLEESEVVFIIPFSCQSINIAQHVYDLVATQVPAKKIHPKFISEDSFEDEDYDDSEDILIYSSESQSEDKNEQAKIDPRWEKLKNLKKKE